MIRHNRLSALAAAAILAGLGGASAIAQDVKAGIDAWEAGNHSEAVGNWQPLAERGDADAQFNLGHAYRLGRGVPQDLRRAEQLYEQAARGGHHEAQAMYGLLLFQNGRRREAMPWVERAAEHGDPRAQYVFGTALFNGDVVAQDIPRAYALMTRAAAQGLPQAASQLQQMEPHLSPGERQSGIALAQAMERQGGVTAAQPPASPPARPPRIAGANMPVRTAPVPPSRTTPPAAQPEQAAPRRRPDPPTAPAIAGRWRIQLGAFSNADNARRHWQDVSRSVSAVSGLQPHYERAGNLTRLQAGPLASRTAAEQACAAVKRAGKGCFTVAP